MTTQYTTKDIGEAAGLLTRNMKLVQIDRKRKICFFVFDDGDECEKLSREFYFGELLVNAREFFEAEKRLKQLIFTK